MSELWVMLFSWALVALAVEAITEIVVASSLMAPVRRWIVKMALPSPKQDPTTFPTWRGYVLWLPLKLVKCGYCLSVWVAGLVVLSFMRDWTLEFGVNHVVVEIAVIHRFANLWHMIIQLVGRGRVWALDVALTMKDQAAGDSDDDEDEGEDGDEEQEESADAR